MRGSRTILPMGLALISATAVLAQGALDGPLSAPGAVANLKDIVSKHPKTVHRAAKRTRPEPVQTGDVPVRDLPTATHAAASNANDPLSFGMKWNGSNDTGSQTRVQNYNGAAAGTGAEVGLKLHF